ncbi:MAG: hypothetical protein NW206_01175 [Hyphomonadaceae bacterium]|nr:hypothetical protein [Hyphomonadaceae bacterium]
MKASPSLQGAFWSLGLVLGGVLLTPALLLAWIYISPDTVAMTVIVGDGGLWVTLFPYVAATLAGVCLVWLSILRLTRLTKRTNAGA